MDSVPCEDTVQSPCIEWAKTSQNLSINVDVYLSSLLSAEEVDFKTDVRNAFLQWNNIAARNPHLQETTSTSNEEIWTTTAGIDSVWFLNNPGKAGHADITNAQTSPFRIQSARI